MNFPALTLVKANMTDACRKQPHEGKNVAQTRRMLQEAVAERALKGIIMPGGEERTRQLNET